MRVADGCRRLGSEALRPARLLAHHARRDSGGDAVDAGCADRVHQFLSERAGNAAAMSDSAEFDRFADNYDECLNDALVRQR